MKKKSMFLVLVVLVVMLALLAGCGSKNNSKDNLKLIDISLSDEEYAFAMSLNNTELKESFNAYLKEIKDNGTFDAIKAKYFEGKGEKEGYSFIGDGSGSASEGKTGEGKFVVGTNCPWEPFEYISNGKIYGLDMEIANGYCKKMNLELIIMNIDFDAILPAIDAGYIDMGMAGMTVSEDRSAYGFTDKYYNASLKLIVSGDNTEFDECKTYDDVVKVLNGLSNKSFGYQNGTTSGDFLAEFKNVKSVGYETAALAAYDIINGNLYGIIVDGDPANAIIASYNK